MGRKVKETVGLSELQARLEGLNNITSDGEAEKMCETLKALKTNNEPCLTYMRNVLEGWVRETGTYKPGLTRTWHGYKLIPYTSECTFKQNTTIKCALAYAWGTNVIRWGAARVERSGALGKDGCYEIALLHNLQTEETIDETTVFNYNEFLTVMRANSGVSACIRDLQRLDSRLLDRVHERLGSGAYTGTQPGTQSSHEVQQALVSVAREIERRTGYSGTGPRGYDGGGTSYANITQHLSSDDNHTVQSSGRASPHRLNDMGEAPTATGTLRERLRRVKQDLDEQGAILTLVERALHNQQKAVETVKEGRAKNYQGLEQEAPQNKRHRTGPA